MSEYFRRFPFLVLLFFLIAGILSGYRLYPGRAAVLCMAGLSVIPLLFCSGGKRISFFERYLPFFIFLTGMLLPAVPYVDISSFIPESLGRHMAMLQDFLKEKNRTVFTDGNISSLANALCLGDRSGIPMERYNAFTESGTVHLLAVSGLHAGAVFLICSTFFKASGIRKSLSGLLSLLLTWGYALLTGFSPSVVRASMVLTFITAGNLFQKDYNAVNGVAACAFFTLLFKPESLFNLSFQLSYLAYSGIVILMPLFCPFQRKGNRILHYIQTAVSLSVSSQLAILPISLYYFHHISLDSFLINIIAVPIATAMLYSDILALLLPEGIGLRIADLLEIPGQALFGSIDIFSRINISATDVEISSTACLACYAIIVSTMIFLYRTDRKRAVRGVFTNRK